MKITIIALSLMSVCILTNAQNENQNEYVNQIKHYSQMIDKDPGDLANYYGRAMAYDALNNFFLSNLDFKTVTELYFNHPSKKFIKEATDACYALADDYYFRNSDRIGARKYVDQGLSISPNDIRFEVLEIALLGSMPDKIAEADRKFNQMIAKYPNDARLLAYYGKFLEGRDAKKAITFYEKSISIDPNDFDVLFALGSYYTNEASRLVKSSGDPGKVLDNMMKALAYFESAHKLNPYDKEIIEILVDYYGRFSRPEDANKMRQKLNTR